MDVEFVQEEIPEKLYEKKITELVEHLVKLDEILFLAETAIEAEATKGAA